MGRSREFKLAIEAPVNGHVRKATITVFNDEGKVQLTDRADLTAIEEREKLVKRLAKKLGKSEKAIRGKVDAGWYELMEQRHEQQAIEQKAAADAPTLKASAGEYLVKDGRIYRLKDTFDGTAPIALCNFNAKIVEEVVRDDGIECSTVLAIEGVQQDGRMLGRAEITADEFPGMSWPVPAWGTSAIVNAGAGTKDHLRAALQHLSGDVPRHIVYTHTGWRQINGAWHYLHAGGAIGPDSGVMVELPDDLRRFHLPTPPTGQDRVTAVRSSLALLDGLAEKKIAYTLLTCGYRAALGSTDFGVHVVGPTGSFKTEVAALIQQHFGPDMDARNLPGSWSSTGNALEHLAFYAKDTVLTVDDFAPCGSTSDVARFHREADRLFRSQGNRSGRQRMRSDGTLRPTRNARGTILSTGEDRPRGHSIQARLSIVEVAPGDVNAAQLTKCQCDAATGLYAQSMSGFIAWLAPQYDAICIELRSSAERLRELAYRDKQHRRTASITGDLAAGWQIFLRFAQGAGAISAKESNRLWNAAWKALVEVAERQAVYHESADPAKQFLRLLSAVLFSGRAHLADKDGGSPVIAPTAYGWRLEGSTYVAKGQRIGWVTEQDIYLEPDASFAEVQKLATDQGESLSVGPVTLHKRLHEQNLLVSADTGRNRLTVRRTLGGVVRAVLHLRAEGFLASESGQSVQTGQGLP
jgi:hypothetical protein